MNLFHGIHLNLFHGIHMDLFHGIHMDLFHGIQGGYACIPYGIQWNPCEFHMELITP